jgi:hypothetical protein
LISASSFSKGSGHHCPRGEPTVPRSLVDCSTEVYFRLSRPNDLTSSLLRSWISFVCRSNNPFFGLNFHLPLLIGAAGILVNFVGGEIDRKKLAKNFKPYSLYKCLFYASIGIMIFAVALGAIMNEQIILSSVSRVLYTAAGIVLVFLISFIISKTKSSKPLPVNDQKQPPVI